MGSEVECSLCRGFCSFTHQAELNTYQNLCSGGATSAASNAAAPSDCTDCAAPPAAPTSSMGEIYEGVPAGGPTQPLQLIDEGAPTPAEAQQSESSQMADPPTAC